MKAIQPVEGKMRLFDKALAAINGRLFSISYIMVGLMVIPMVLDVAVRFIFRQSISGVIEVQEFSLAIIAFLAFPQIETLKENIRIDLFVKRFPRHLRDIFNNINYLLVFILISMVTWQSVLTAFKKSMSRSITLGIPVSIFIGLAAVGLLLLSLTLLKNYLSSLIELINKHNPLLIFIPLLVGLGFLLFPFYVKYISLGLSGLSMGVMGIVFLFALLVIGMPLGFSMALVGYLGLYIVTKNSAAVFGVLGSAPYFQTANYVLVVLPMFMLMGALTYASGISKDLFNAAQKWLGWIPGGVAVASVAGCAGFSAVCGDSMSTAVTMGTVAFPEMKKLKYHPGIATGCLAAGGTLGILIPPSIGFIIYSILTEESVGKLFIAGIVPGILLTLLFIGCIFLLAIRKPHLFPPGERFSLSERLYSLKGIWAVIAIFVLILGGMLVGVFSPNEAGAVGAFGVFVIALIRRRIAFQDFKTSLKSTAAIAAKIFIIIIGVGIFGYFLAATRFPAQLADLILGIGLGKYAFILVVCVLYIILGCLMNVIPMIMLTLPAIFPSVVALGFDPLWFGVLIVILMEMGQITPPIGVIAFALSTITEVPMAEIFRGIVPFLICMVLCILILIAFPQIALFLVQLLF